MKNLLLIPLLGFLLLTCDSIMGLDSDSLTELIHNSTIESDGTPENMRIFCGPRRLKANIQPYYIIHDIIIPPNYADKFAFRYLDPEKITSIKILKEEKTDQWLHEQNITPKTEVVGIVFIETSQENWDEGLSEFQRVK